MQEDAYLPRGALWIKISESARERERERTTGGLGRRASSRHVRSMTAQANSSQEPEAEAVTMMPQYVKNTLGLKHSGSSGLRHEEDRRTAQRTAGSQDGMGWAR